ncbi:hypothetical protein COLO4_10009 [Corchorus olitorius]|uniref:Armadillo-like helical n=1 Tax=Corchorus olitorius TaxID=93759 RepID=A0A1R3KAI2_9ROSI|nr:hypothetical protein COLO4_10009 [Corchorus olitorius]
MARQANTFFLEQWLMTNSGGLSQTVSGHSSSSTSASSSLSARAIIQAWSELRDSLQNKSVHPNILQPLKTLFNSQASLHVADPQAKLLLSILSSQSFDLPSESHPILLRLLYIWVRKSVRPSTVLIESVMDVLSRVFSTEFGLKKTAPFLAEGVLLLGAISSVPPVSESSKIVCLELLCQLLEEDYRLVRSWEEIIPEVLAGIGYALSSSVDVHFVKILDSLLGIWGKEDGPSNTVPTALMILHLVEWVVSGLIKSRAFKKIQAFSQGTLGTPKPNYVPFALVMVAAGVLRATRSADSGQGLENVSTLRISAENQIVSVAQNLITKTKGLANSNNEESKILVESCIWEYCRDVYSGHRQVAMVLRSRKDDLLVALEKIAESAFLMVVVFALAVTKHRLNSNFSQEMQREKSVQILVTFSCLEYFRRIRLPEYMDTIRRVVACVQENESACISFVESIPSYIDLTTWQDFSSKQKMEYEWSKDEVQTSRMLFYVRVIPTCVERLPAPMFRRVVTPTMFLYMGHPNEKVAQASHSMFVAFISSGKDSDDERVLLKEQLVFYYMQRSLEGYPGITPFEGMASGVAALVRHLPAGSPATFYCINSLVDKTNKLCSDAPTLNADEWKNWQGELEPCKKILQLLLRLISLVDIQVLPVLMKSLAQVTVQLPKAGQNMVLNELYAQVAESDDVTRKPTLVSWLQSLSYLCSQAESEVVLSKRRDSRESPASPGATESLKWDKINARL